MFTQGDSGSWEPGACGRIGLIHSSADLFNINVLGSPWVSDTDVQQCQDRRGPCSDGVPTLVVGER